MSRNQLMRASDPLAIFISVVVGCLGLFGVWERAGLGADDVAELGALALMAAAAVRMFFESRKAREEAEDGEPFDWDPNEEITGVDG
ncbi:MAG: hypothetical protein AAFS10_25160 [Myxococcota bacterium]